MSTRIERCMRTLGLSRDCATLGARIRTIHHITGVSTRELLRLLFTDRNLPPRGRTPDTREWYHSANLLCRTEASVIVTNFRRLHAMEFSAGEALVCAYRYYLSVYRSPRRISFDRAFDLVSHTEGIWIATVTSFSVIACPACGSDFLDSLGSPSGSNMHCPFCRLLQRVDRDPRVKAAFPCLPPVARESAQRLMQQLHMFPAPSPDSPSIPGSFPAA